MEFNALHPEQFVKERGWEDTPNPFAPKRPIPAHTYSDKHIFIYANQLWYDIDATTNMVGRARRNNQTAQEDVVPTSENDEERPLFYRWFDKYFAKVETILTAYVMKPTGNVRDNAIKQWEEKELWLRMPDSWDETRYDALVQAIHDYISSGALYEYFSIMLTSKDPLTVDKYGQVEEAEQSIIDLANTVKPGSLPHMLKPFG